MKAGRRRARLLALCLAGAALSGCAGAKPRVSRGNTVLNAARGQIGRPYKFGGRSPRQGFDCSGLAWWTHRRSGIEIPRSAARQYRSGKKVRKSELQPGDLIFFTTYRPGPSHVGIYTGKGTFIHSPKTGRTVRESKLSNPYWKKRYLGARRYR